MGAFDNRRLESWLVDGVFIVFMQLCCAEASFDLHINVIREPEGWRCAIPGKFMHITSGCNEVSIY